MLSSLKERLMMANRIVTSTITFTMPSGFAPALLRLPVQGARVSIIIYKTKDRRRLLARSVEPGRPSVVIRATSDPGAQAIKVLTVNSPVAIQLEQRVFLDHPAVVLD